MMGVLNEQFDDGSLQFLPAFGKIKFPQTLLNI